MPGIRARCTAVLATLTALAAPARADEPATVQWSAAAGVGAGFLGAAPVSAVEARGDLAWDGGALGLGARLRLIGDQLATDDWNDASDWLAVLRYLVVRNRAARTSARAEQAPCTRSRTAEQVPCTRSRARLAVAAGSLGAVRVGSGTLIDGYFAGALADRRATGVHARAGWGQGEGELVIGDVARGEVIAASAGAPVGPVMVGGAAAVDPRAPVRAGAMAIGTAPLLAVAAMVGVDGAAARRRGRLVLDVGWEPGLGAGVAIVGDGAVRLGERVLLRGRGEVGLGSPRWIAAPFGPLYLRMREAPSGRMGETLLDRARGGELGGVGGAGEVALEVDDLGAVSGAVRRRPGLGTELTARASLPATAGLQVAALLAWIPGEPDALLVGGEAHAELGHRLWSGLEVARQYRGGDDAGLYAERPVWQVTAWFGVVR